MSLIYCSVDREQNKLGIGGISEVIEERKGMRNIEIYMEGRTTCSVCVDVFIKFSDLHVPQKT